jgi:hypothetical protein
MKTVCISSAEVPDEEGIAGLSRFPKFSTEYPKGLSQPQFDPADRIPVQQVPRTVSRDDSVKIFHTISLEMRESESGERCYIRSYY